MKRITLRIETINDSFFPDPREEIARILREVADKMVSGELPRYTFNILQDINGNTVGNIKVEG